MALSEEQEKLAAEVAQRMIDAKLDKKVLVSMGFLVVGGVIPASELLT